MNPLISSAIFAASLIAGGAFLPQTLAAEPPQNAQRIASVGGAVTEIIWALGEQHRVIARDTTSVFPPDVLDLPDVGYMRRLSPEGILMVNPDLVLTEPGSGPPETLELLAEAQIPFIDVPGDYSANGILTRIHAVADALGVPEKGDALAARIGAELEAVKLRGQARVTEDSARPKVLFILSMPGGRLNVSGTGTRADGIIKMAGGRNAISEFDQYRILADEAIITAAPDVILMMTATGTGSTSNGEILAHPAIQLTPAGQNNAIIRMDGSLMLGFGPRTAEAATQLTEAFFSKPESQ
ncbi:heme/hemin ABC transporter substrate-binding protein [Halocynthiibacter namhaensis]|uniref:heme/hemin ABC transporter substrate-binding protein n=1 Tax=Halocynthiibacter namhaensis TaxID=1290553 RepID=UPI0005792330|nr:ABC transporter substrate-binding protein [Halocynthiibacter namhaensis]